MGIFHFLNVRSGDCQVIQHPSGRVTVIDVCNARTGADQALATIQKSIAEALGIKGNFNQKNYPVEPISYMQERGITDVFRFILTHPDMDHMDGIKDFFEEFSPTNFWDTANNCEKDFSQGSGGYRPEDWEFYKSLRDESWVDAPKRLLLYSGSTGKFYNKDGDGLHVLAPTKGLVNDANDCGDYNDCSYVILYSSSAGRIVFGGDSHDKTWEHIIATHKADVEDVEILVAPHHGRKSNRDYGFLDVLRPKVTLFGNASHEHLAYGAWNSRGLKIITNNQADCVVVDTNGSGMEVYASNKRYAEEYIAYPTYSSDHGAYHIGYI